MDPPSTSPFALEIDPVADAFEAEWRAAGRAEVGAFLTRVPPAARPDLLRELVRVEVEYRRKAGEAASVLDYLRQYQARYAGLTGLSPPPPPPRPEDSPRSDGQFEFLRELGRGGMGVVWLARDRLLNREVAVKVLPPGAADADSVSRMLREARAAAGLRHPNVITVHQVLEQDGQLLIVMELLGGSLADELRDAGRLAWPEAAEAIRDAAAGLAAAHAAGLVHRDVKPSNLLRTPQGRVKVADFGLVHSPDATPLTPAGVPMGTPSYMSPEQCRGEPADARTDVYALGCTFYHLLTGRPPFEADDSPRVMRKHCDDPFPDPREHSPDLPDAVGHFIATACRKDAGLRYRTAAEMGEALAAAMAPAEPPPDPLPAGARLRIFISSPGDVAEERVRANNLVRRLADEYLGRLTVEPVFWEHEPLLAHDTFQSQIPPPRDCDIAICILWSRLGTRLPAAITRPDGSTYASGTEYEFEDAVEGRKANGHPDLLVYRKTAKPLFDITDRQAILRRLDQKEALDAFVQKWFFGDDGTLRAAFHTFETTADFEQVLEHHLRKLIARRLPVGGTVPVAPPKPSWTGSPFRGLDVFEFEHAPVFFGRTQAVGDVLNALRANAAAGRAFVLVVGVSGGGKSSLVRAGVLPVLTQPGVIEGVALWRRAVLKPGDAGGGDLLRALASALLARDALPELAADGTTADQLATLLRDAPAGAFPLIKGGLSQAAASVAREQDLTQQPDARLVVVVDQLEELFTLRAVTPAERQAFVAALSSLARGGGRVFVIATLRGDFYHRALELAELVTLQEGSGQYALPPPSAAEIGQMIRQPARAAGLTFEENPANGVPLDEVVRADTSASPESLPLLEFALAELFQRQTAGLLTYAAYEDLGRVEGALARRAGEVFDDLPAEVQATLPRVMRALVSVGEGGVVARQQPPVDAVAPTPAARAFVDAFVGARLFSADRTDAGVAVVRVTHEALLRNWPEVRDSLAQDRELLIVRARVAAAAARWQAEGRPSDRLLGEGKPLQEGRTLAATLGDELSPDERAFVAASASRTRFRRRLKRTAVAALAMLTLVAALAATYANHQRRLAAAQQRAAEQQRQIADQQRELAQLAKGIAEDQRRKAEQQRQIADQQRQLAERAKGVADNQRRKAERRFNDVRELANTFMFDIHDAIENLAGSTKARALLVRTALKYLDGLATEAEGDLKLQRQLAVAYLKVGEIQGGSESGNLGDVYGATASYGKALGIFKRLSAAEPADAEARRDLSVSYNKVGGVLLRTGQPAQALASYRQALEITKALSSADPTDAEARRDLSVSYERVGKILLQTGQTTEALTSYRQSLNLLTKLSAADPTDARAQRDLSFAYNNVGDVLLQTGQPAQALASYRQALNLRRKLAAADPTDARARRDLAVGYEEVGNVLLETGKSAEALASYRQSRDLLAKLAAADPTDARARRDLFVSHTKMGLTYWSIAQAQYTPDAEKLGALVQASASFGAALAVSEQMRAAGTLEAGDTSVPATLARVVAASRAAEAAAGGGSARPASRPATAPATRP